MFGAFAIVAVVLLHRLTVLAPRPRYAAAFGMALATGGLVELIQPALGRGSAWFDLMTDGFGAIAGLAIAAWFEFGRSHPRARPVILLILAVAALPVLWPIGEAALAYGWRAHRFPTLLLASSHFDRYFLDRNGSEISPQALPTAWLRAGEPASLQVRITSDRWPGIALSEPQPDWTGYAQLLLDVTNPDAQPLALTVRVHDRRHDNDLADRFSRRFVLAAAARQLIAIPLEDVARGPASRRLDLSQVAGLILFSEGGAALRGRTYYVTRIWLEPIQTVD